MIHTDLPWSVSEIRISKKKSMVAIKNGESFICKMYEQTGLEKENAEFIVKACNSHQNLIETLKAAILRVELENEEGNPIMSAWLPDAKSVLENAEGCPVDGDIHSAECLSCERKECPYKP